MKYRCMLKITAVFLTAAFFTVSLPAPSLAAELPSGGALESEMTEGEGTETEAPGNEGTESEAQTAGTESAEISETDAESSAEEETQTAESWPAGPAIAAPSGILMEAATGTVLYDKNMHEQHYPASITKVMTALLAIENCDLDEIVTVPHEAVYMEDKGSHIALDEGEELSVEDCLYAIMLASANDAAYALAVHVGGRYDERKGAGAGLSGHAFYQSPRASGRESCDQRIRYGPDHKRGIEARDFPHGFRDDLL